MASTLLLTFNETPQYADNITIGVNNGSTNIQPTLQASDIASSGYYVLNASDYINSSNFVFAWNRDFKNIGGINNITASVRGDNEVMLTLTAENWIFLDPTGSSISSARISFEKENAAPVTPKTLDVVLGETVDCANKKISYDLTIGGGTAPYSIQGTADGTVSSAGTSKEINLFRGIPATIIVKDSLGVEIGRKSLSPPIAIETGFFNITTYQSSGAINVDTAPNVNLPSTILPLTYSIDDSTYGSSGSFTGLSFETSYTVYIKDKFGCKISKLFVTPEEITGADDLPTNYARYSKISNAGTLIFKEYKVFSSTVKKNHTNTLSCEEMTRIAYSYTQEFDTGDFIVQQFKSSYAENTVTLLTESGSFNIVPVLQSQNIGLLEKVDCKLFRTVDGGLGIYFRNGNTYEPNTTTVLGTSEYSATNLPTWAETGKLITIDGIGDVLIKRVTRDSNVGLYIQTGALRTTEAIEDGKVQVSYNKQNYNTYEFGFYMSSVVSYGRIIIEKGFNGLVEKTYVSERIKKITDSNDYLLFQWNDPENKADIVHQTGISHFARLKASLTLKTSSESDTYRGDNASFNIDQDAYNIGILRIAVFGFLMQEKLHLASGMENFVINNLNYRKTKLESEIQEASNIYILEGELELGGNNLEVNADELVLKDPLTGITNKPSIPAVIPSILAVSDSRLVLNGVGGFVLVSDT